MTMRKLHYPTRDLCLRNNLNCQSVVSLIIILQPCDWHTNVVCSLFLTDFMNHITSFFEVFCWIEAIELIASAELYSVVTGWVRAHWVPLSQS